LRYTAGKHYEVKQSIDVSGKGQFPIDFVPIVYLGHHQEFMFLCGDFGEAGTSTTSTKEGEISCP
jgi:hypothetical protein